MRNKPNIEYKQLQTIGDRIRAIRDKQSQEQFAAALDVSRDTVSNWECGNTPPLLTHILKICDLYSVDVDYILGRIDCSTHDIQFVRNKTGLSEDAIQKLYAIKDRASIGILSDVITHRLFVNLLRAVDTLGNANTNRQFADSVRAYLASRLDDTDITLPYMDSPDDIRAVYQYQVTRLFDRIIDDLTAAKKE